MTLNEGLKQKGIHLIVVPVPTQVTTHAHRLSERFGPDRDLMPAYTKSLIDLIDAGVEVIDLRQAYAEAAEAKIPVMHLADHHWAGGGLAIAAKELAPRLLRIKDIANQDRRPSDWERSETTMKTPHLLLWAKGNGLWGSRGSDYRYPTREAALEANGIPDPEPTISFKYKGKKRLKGEPLVWTSKGVISRS